MRVVLTLVLAVMLTGCGGAATESVAVRSTTPAPPAPQDRPVSTVLSRTTVDATIQKGLGAFLARVDVEASMKGEAFDGFRIVRFRDAQLADAGLELGDVVQRVNGESIEKPDDALRAFESLRVASELVIECTRDGEALRLRWTIEDPS